MPGDSVSVGPWVGGLNTYSDDTSVADNEAVLIENFELDLDGSLVSRPPIVDLSVAFPLGATGNVSYLGYYYADGAVPYLIASDGLSSTYYYSGSSWVLITNTVAASAMAQFDNKAWLVAPIGSANPGGSWEPVGGFVAVADMPKGDSIVAHKFRLWIAPGRSAVTNGTRLYFSQVLGAAPFWKPAPDFIDIGAGDGQNIVACTIYYSNLLVFRTDSVYSFTYTSDPASGVASLVLPGIGLADKDCLVANEQYLYFMYEERAYEFVNNRAGRINDKVPFDAISRTGIYKPYAVSVFNSRVIFSYFDTMFVFSLKTRTWTTWRSPLRGPIGRVVELTGMTQPTAYLHSTASIPSGPSRTAATYRIVDAVSADAEAFLCVLQTKNYNYELSSSYKRLFWWGADAVFRGMVKAVASPITYNRAVSWGELGTTTWGSRLDYRWSQPMDPSIAIETVRDTTGTGSVRKFVKFLKGLRFRQINYRVTFDTDGSITTAPVRLFKLETYVRAKQGVGKAIT